MLEKCSACCADGSAMFTIVASSTTISWASATTARISQRRGPGPAAVAGLAQVGAEVCTAMWFMVLDPFRVRRSGIFCSLTQICSSMQVRHRMYICRMAEIGLRERSKARRRAAIIRAAYELFAERGYDATTVADIAEAAEVAPRTVAMYFPAKQDIALSRFSDGVASLTDAIRDRR